MDPLTQRQEDDLRLRFQEKSDTRYVQSDEYEEFKAYRFGLVEKLIFGFCGLALVAVVTAVLAFVINKPI